MTKKRRSSFREKVSANSTKQKKQGSSYGYLNLPRGISLFKEEVGVRAFLDFLPYKVTDERHLDRNDDLGIAVPGELWYKKPFYIHRNVGVGNEAVVCPTTIGKRCPICEYRAKRVKEGADKEELRSLRPSLRNLYVVVPIEHKEYDEVPHIWDISQYLFQNLLNDEIDENPDYGIFPDVEEGMTLKIRFSEAAIGKNKFAEVSRIDFKEREQEYDDKTLSKVPNLDECLTIHSYAELERIFLEIEEEEEEENEESPKKEVSQTDKKTKEQDDDDEDVEIEEEEEERRERKRRRKQVNKDEEKKEVKQEEEKNPCPFGHVFGKDCDKFADCDKCDKWDDCIEAQDA